MQACSRCCGLFELIAVVLVLSEQELLVGSHEHGAAVLLVGLQRRAELCPSEVGAVGGGCCGGKDGCSAD